MIIVCADDETLVAQLPGSFLTYTIPMSKFREFRGSLSPSESRLFTRLNSPAKIQDFLNSLPFNHERHGETYMSPRRMIAAGRAHCFEGALFAAAVLMYHGHKPLLLDLQTTSDDQDHVVALFREGKYWGAISKTNHAVLRFRDPVYASVRELALSYFHEYFLSNGKKTMRAYSDPFDVSKLPIESWLTAEDDLIDMVNALDESPHHDVVSKDLVKRLRKADEIEIKTFDSVEWKRSGKRGT